MSAKKAKKGSKAASKQRAPKAPQAQLFYYFVVSGEVEYRDGDQLKTMRVNGIHAEPIQPGKPDGITVRGLAQIQTTLQIHFHRKYAREYGTPVEITDVVIVSINHLGTFTKEQFHAGEPEGVVSEPAPEEKADPTPAEPTLPQEPAEQSLPVAQEPETFEALGAQVFSTSASEVAAEDGVVADLNSAQAVE